MFIYNYYNPNKKLIFLLSGLILIGLTLMFISKRRRIDNELSIETIDTFNPSDHLIMLDWDDTILPTTDIAKNLSDFEEYKKAIMASASEFISMCIKLSRRVYIVTNADMGWVVITMCCYISKSRKYKTISR